MARIRRSEEEIARILDGYRASGTSKAEYCRRTGITVRTLDYYRRRQNKSQPLVRVRLEVPKADQRFVLVLGNGRRIESGWSFGEAELARLIRVVEAV